jgi:hypothetical protein
MPWRAFRKNEGGHSIKSGRLRLDSPPPKLRAVRSQVTHSELFVSVTTITPAVLGDRFPLSNPASCAAFGAQPFAHSVNRSGAEAISPTILPTRPLSHCDLSEYLVHFVTHLLTARRLQISHGRIHV